MDWLVLALITPLLWSIVVLIDDNLVRGIYRSPHTGAMVSGFFGLLPLISLLWLEVNYMEPFLIGVAVLGGFLTILNYYFYFQALEIEVPSIVIAMFSLTPAILPFLAYALLGESLTKGQITGFIVILFFTFFLAAIDVKKFKFSKALAPVAVASVFVAFALICSKYVYERTDFYSGYIYFCVGMGLGGLFFFYLKFFQNKRSKKQIKGIKKNKLVYVLVALVLTELINIAAEFTSNLAVSKGPVSLVEVIQNTQPMYMLIIALLLYPLFPKYFREAKEGRVGFKIFMMLGIVVGVALTISG